MHDPTVDQYVELALDLSERKRAIMLNQLEREDPEVARSVRALLTGAVRNSDFACQTGVSGRPRASVTSHAARDSLHHVAISVGEIARAVVWYRERFGCTVDYEDDSWALLRFANSRLALVLPSQHPPHFAVSRPDANEFGALTQHRDGSRSTYVADPWGNAIEVMDSESIPDATSTQSGSEET